MRIATPNAFARAAEPLSRRERTSKLLLSSTRTVIRCSVVDSMNCYALLASVSNQWLACETVKTYLAAAGGLGLSTTGPPPTETQLIELRRLGVVATQPITRVALQG